MKAGVAGLSGPLALVLLLPMEAGVPIPVPADLVMFAVGERVAAGKFPLWLAVTGFEIIAVLGTTALFVACRGPAQRIIARFGPRLGLTEARLRRAADFAETKGRPGLALGRGRKVQVRGQLQVVSMEEPAGGRDHPGDNTVPGKCLRHTAGHDGEGDSQQHATQSHG